MRAAFHGLARVRNDASLYVDEYLMRERLAKLGFRDDLSELDQKTAESFVIISQEIDKLTDQKLKKRK